MQRSRAVLLAATLAFAVAACGDTTHTSSPPAPVRRAGSTVAAGQTRIAPSRHVGDSIVATALTRDVPVYRSPGSSRAFLHLSNPTAVHEPLVFLVKKRSHGWEQVFLPIRPDGAAGWINDRYLTLAWNPYSLQVRLSEHQLILRKHGRVVARFAAAVGRSALPTPHGRYYLVDLLRQPDPGGEYGPFAFGTSAFSHVLYSFGGGPGQIGIHGTNERTSIGHSASHGCIRISNRDITRLAHTLPLGTPVTIGN